MRRLAIIVILQLNLICLICGLAYLIWTGPTNLLKMSVATELSKTPRDTPPVISGTHRIKPLKYYKTTISQPVFYKGRRPPPLTQPPKPKRPQRSISKRPRSFATPPPDLKVLGLLITERERRTLLEDRSGKKAWFKVGQSIGGWRIISIKTNSITVVLGARRIEYSLYPRAQNN